VQLTDFNTLDDAAAALVVRPCADVDSFVEAVVTARPYDDLDDLMTTAVQQAATWTGAEVEAALADHPRIGEQHAGGAGAPLSSAEQAGVDPADGDVTRRLAEGNRRYEETFDRIFLVRAAGRSAEEILALLDERLGNDPDTELEVTKGQLAEIAVLRLRGLFVGAGAR
jgi:2-oxo-4-hydroxy-4-carboxy-5-ureidoimidazoline decarboxylase